jgi:uncharacterized protein (TIGR03435 family)
VLPHEANVIYTRAGVQGSSRDRRQQRYSDERRGDFLTFQKRAMAISGAAIVCIAASAQTPAPAHRKFQIVSIKKNISGAPRVYVNPFAFQPGGRFVATNVTLAELIVVAYATPRVQMEGGPEWIDSERFNIAAMANETEVEVPSEQLVSMVQSLLEDRFKLMLHRETEERTVYALIPAKIPPTLQPAKDGEQTAMVQGARGQLNFQKMPMAGLVTTLANIFHTPVVDGTGLTGFFDFTLDPMKFSSVVQGAAAIYPNLVVTALREQLGLKLEKRKAPLVITIVDHAEDPIDN